MLFLIKKIDIELVCPWSGPLSTREAHLTDCGYQFVNCPNLGCVQLVQKRLLDIHLADICSNRPQPCSCCQQIIPQSQMESHSIGCSSVYQGEIKKGKRHGQGKYTAPDGSSTYEGQ